ncbi:MAG: helix-turn-helix domain-containing protein [Sphaerochaetaceae bacterium]|nr:helix-turn-helix domain-containing protein [Sphaerochaetaceae bacterium]
MTIREQELQVCKKLKTLREEKKLSQLELSMASDVSQNMIAYIENGKRTPTLATLLKLCSALNINPSVLFEDSDEQIGKIKKLLHEYIDRFVR